MLTTMLILRPMHLAVNLVCSRFVDINEFAKHHALVEIDIQFGGIGTVFDDGLVVVISQRLKGFLLITPAEIDRTGGKHLDEREPPALQRLFNGVDEVPAMEHGPPGHVGGA